jgi:cytochrome c556
MISDLQLQASLGEAEEALEQGKAARAMRKLWRAATLAVYRNNEAGLEATVQLAEVALNAGRPGVREDARVLRAFCEGCLEDIRAGRVKKRTIAELFTIRRQH